MNAAGWTVFFQYRQPDAIGAALCQCMLRTGQKGFTDIFTLLCCDGRLMRQNITADAALHLGRRPGHSQPADHLRTKRYQPPLSLPGLNQRVYGINYFTVIADPATQQTGTDEDLFHLQPCSHLIHSDHSMRVEAATAERGVSVALKPSSPSSVQEWPPASCRTSQPAA